MLNNNLEETQSYVSNEIQIGTWMGKPLYRKSYSGSGSITNQFTVDSEMTSSYIDEVVKIYGSATDGNVIVPIKYFYGTSDYLSTYVSTSGLHLFRIGSTLSRYTMTIEYTKK